MIRQDDHQKHNISKHGNHSIIESSVFYKYYSEFHVKNADFIQYHMSEFEINNIRIEVIIEDLKKHLSRRPLNLRKRSLDISSSKSIVGKYVGFNDV